MPGYNSDVHDMRQAKKRAERRWRRTLVEVDRQIYLGTSDVSNRCVEISKRAYFNQSLVDADRNWQKDVFTISSTAYSRGTLCSYPNATAR